MDWTFHSRIAESRLPSHNGVGLRERPLNAGSQERLQRKEEAGT